MWKITPLTVIDFTPHYNHFAYGGIGKIQSMILFGDKMKQKPIYDNWFEIHAKREGHVSSLV